jgi:hypothetical protein
VLERLVALRERKKRELEFEGGNDRATCPSNAAAHCG